MLAYAYLNNQQVSNGLAILENVVAIQQKTLKEDDCDRLPSEYWLARAYVSDGQQIGNAIAILEHVVAVGKGLDKSDRKKRDLLAKAYSMQSANCSRCPEYPAGG
ncbi:hypothetical protein ANO14919_131320 [Xylariales sp. No.14919]|nr:hypothetical protein ANO14919_131320 [Xylariales sp. No.14919]